MLLLKLTYYQKCWGQTLVKINKINKSGFTIVELLVVIVVIGILAAITIVSYSGISNKAIAASLQSDLDNNSKLLKLYNVEHGYYPATLDSDNCPLTPAQDKRYCLKSSAETELVYTGGGQSFQLKATRSGQSYIITNDSVATAYSEPTLAIGETWTFDGAEASKAFIAEATGKYKIELWGQGGKGHSLNNTQVTYGSYVSGEINLAINDDLCVQVNYGGGTGGGDGENGGGATDVRYDCTDIASFASLKSRIIVAGGGGSAGYNSYVSYQGGIGGNGGGLTGYDGLAPNYNSGSLTAYAGKGATQIAGGAKGTYNSTATTGQDGSFGKGGSSGSQGWPGGGGGYYGGGAGGYYHQSAMNGGGGGGSGGGSSYISGHNGCNSISDSSIESSIVHTGSANHYSGFTFSNSNIIDGSGYTWTNVKGSQSQMPSKTTVGAFYTLGIGNSDGGYARITYIGA